VALFRENIGLTETFRPGVFEGDLLHFAAVGDDGAGRSAASQWGPYVSGRIEDHAIACGHHSMLRPPTGPDRPRDCGPAR
jgi:thioesterase domain-containing protein